MSKKFTVQSNEPIEIFGKEYNVDVTNIDLLEKMENQRPGMEAALEKLQGERTTAAAKEFVVVMIEFIDLLLGEGEGSVIWEASKHSLNTLVEALTFLTNEVKEQKLNTADRYLKR